MKKLVLVAVLVMLVLVMVAPTASAAPPAAPPASGGYWYHVNYGDTLAGISWYTGVPMQAIINANGIVNPNWIYAGQYLWIPAYAPGPYPGPYMCSAYHTVQYGQTLYGISLMYGRNMWSIAQANNIYNLNWIYAGQVLCIP